tara:strand:+ start:22068 stop:22367 length:300 start_codon:yes stop_codon:yes gene_type:complete
MAENVPTGESQSQAAERFGKIVESKEYVDNPEILPWYRKELKEIKPRTRELLETYSKIPPADVESHVHKVVSWWMPTVCLLDLIQTRETMRSKSSHTHV